MPPQVDQITTHPELKPCSTSRRCSMCRNTKTLDNFAGRHRYCGPCHSKYRRSYSATLSGRVHILAKTAKQTAKYREKRPRREDTSGECTLTAEEIHTIYEDQMGLCCVTKIPMSLQSHLNITMSLDRLDDSKGYHSENVRLVCHSVNAARKFEATDILCFPIVNRHVVAMAAAEVARFKNKQQRSIISSS